MSLTKEIQSSVCKAEIIKGNLVCENLSYVFIGEMDVCAFNKTGYATEFEIKISRRDFHADKLKYKWQFFEMKSEKHIPNYFYYVCPEGLIKESELKDYMGLIYFANDELTVIKKAKLIHKHKPNSDTVLKKVIRITNWRTYLGASRLTIKNRIAKENENPDFIGA